MPPEAQAVDPAIFAPLAARFAGNPRTRAANARWAARFQPVPPEPETPWSIIWDVLAKGCADGLSDRQVAGGVYAVLVARGLLSEGRA